MNVPESIVSLYEAYAIARDAMHLDPYRNTRAEKALNTRRFNELYRACERVGLRSIEVIPFLDEQRRDKSPIRIEI